MSPDLAVTSTLLPIAHGFTLRTGGVSEGAFASLNVAQGLGDDPARVHENLERVARAGGFALPQLATARQVHGTRLVHASELEGAPEGLEADAVWTDVAGDAVGVRVADCVPVVLVDPDGRRVAAIHSGWRGTHARIVESAVASLQRQGGDVRRWLAAIGPCIGPCCYEVSPELALTFAGELGPETAPTCGGVPHLDLRLAVRRSLERAGLMPHHIDAMDLCTSCEAGRFFSHRRDRGATGRHLAFAVCRF